MRIYSLQVEPFKPSITGFFVPHLYGRTVNGQIMLAHC